VVPLGLPHVGGHGDHRHAGDQASGDRQRGFGSRLGQHRNPLRTSDAFGHRRGSSDEVAAAERDVSEADGIGDIATAGNRGGIQRGQQHVCRVLGAPSHPSTVLRGTFADDRH
jgi:hypothetical protein